MQYNNAAHLLSLPSVVIKEVLDYLEFEDLKTLRITCKSTKCWVEQPTYFTKFVLSIKDDEHLSQVSQTTTAVVLPWVHINFAQIQYLDNGAAKLLLCLRQSLKSLTIGPILDSLTPYFDTKNLIRYYLKHLGPNLESLKLIGHFTLSPLAKRKKKNPPTTPRQKKLRKKLKSLSFPNLRELSVISATPYPYHADPGLTWRFVSTLLECCPNLTRIEFPFLPSAKTSLQRRTPLPNPFIPYLAKLSQKPRQEQQQRPTKFILDLCSDRDVIDWEELKGVEDLTSIFELDLTKLLELAQLCVPLNGKLLNVPISALPTHAQAKNLSAAELGTLTQSVGSVLCTCTDARNGVANIYIPSGTSVFVSISIDDYAELLSSDFDLPQETKVTHISLACGVEWMVDMNGFLIAVLQTVRPTVSVLKIQYEIPDAEYSLSTYFPNLKKLALLSVHDSDTWYLVDMFSDLPQSLEELDFEDCEFAEECFFAEGERTRDTLPILCNLPNLKYLRLWSCLVKNEDGNESDVDFEAIFKGMDLKKFEFKKIVWGNMSVFT